MNLTIRDFDGKEPGEIEVSERLFARKFNAALLHHAAVAAMANARAGTRKQKSRSEVRGTRGKMYRQKGSGRSRAGHRSSPIRRGGGRAFPASPLDNFAKKINRREFKAAMAVALSQLARENRVSVVREMRMDTGKTRDLLPRLAAIEVVGKVLLVDIPDEDANLILASRNLPNVHLMRLSFLLPSDLLNADYVVFSLKALERSAEIWG